MNFIKNTLLNFGKTAVHLPRFSATVLVVQRRTFTSQTKLPVSVVDANKVRLNTLSDNEGAKKKVAKANVYLF